jgi:hypothetical protein
MRIVQVDGILVRFPACIVFFREGFESEMDFYLADPASSQDNYWSSFDLIYYVYRPALATDPLFKEPVLINLFSPHASLEKVENGIRDLCRLIQAFLLPCIQGDFRLIEAYRKAYPMGPIQ